MTQPIPCRSRPNTDTCIQRLAAGWILPNDLCPPCTSRFMAALESLGDRLEWSQGFRDRAVGGGS
jgi:hypothetical protein